MCINKSENLVAWTQTFEHHCNCLENIPYQEDKLRPFKRELTELTDRNSSFKNKKIVVQRGDGVLGVGLFQFSKHLPNYFQIYNLMEID